MEGEDEPAGDDEGLEELKEAEDEGDAEEEEEGGEFRATHSILSISTGSFFWA